MGADRKDLTEITTTRKLGDPRETGAVAEHIPHLYMEPALGCALHQLLEGRPVVASRLIKPDVFLRVDGRLRQREALVVACLNRDCRNRRVLQQFSGRT